MLRPLGSMEEDHGPPPLAPAKRLSFSSLLEPIIVKTFLANVFNVDMLAKNKRVDSLNENMLSCKDISALNINRPMPQL